MLFNSRGYFSIPKEKALRNADGERKHTQNQKWPLTVGCKSTVKGHFCSLLVSIIFCYPLFHRSAFCYRVAAQKHTNSFSPVRTTSFFAHSDLPKGECHMAFWGRFSVRPSTEFVKKGFIVWPNFYLPNHLSTVPRSAEDQVAIGLYLLIFTCSIP